MTTNAVPIDHLGNRSRLPVTPQGVGLWFLSLFPIMGAVTTIVGIGLAIHSFYFGIGTKETTGVVIELVGWTHHSPSVEYKSPIVEYHIAGERLTYRSTIWAAPSVYVLGDKVTMIYHPGNPRRAQINSFHDRWFVAVACFGSGILAIGLSYLIRKLDRIHNRSA